jgi:hypothetical protein
MADHRGARHCRRRDRDCVEHLAGFDPGSGYAAMEADVGPVQMTEQPGDLLTDMFVRYSDERKIARYEMHDHWEPLDPVSAGVTLSTTVRHYPVRTERRIH